MAFLKSFKTIKYRNIYQINQMNYSKSTKINSELKKSYKILGIPEDSDQETIRTAYLELVKKYHPDSGTDYSNSEKFQQIDDAFRLIIDKKTKERWQVEDETDDSDQFDIKHTAPQHRQYLDLDGIGIGTPFQRQKQYEQIRARRAAENILTHRINNQTQADSNSLIQKKIYEHKIKTQYGFDRLVEDLIQEAMSRGEFDNLHGKGKPLKNQTIAPHLDFITHKLNEVLIENGFTPQWISLQKEIRNDKQKLEQKLQTERNKLGTYPFNEYEQKKWNEMLENEGGKIVSDINKKIDTYNLLVPMLQKQMLRVNLKSMAENIAQTDVTNLDCKSDEKSNENVVVGKNKNFLQFLLSLYLHK